MIEMKFLTLVTPDLGISLLKMEFLTLVTSDLGTSLVKTKFLSCAYVVSARWCGYLAKRTSGMGYPVYSSSQGPYW